MNRISPKTLLHSKWTKVDIHNKEKHFVISGVTFDEEQRVVDCVIQAVMTGKEYNIQWRDLKDNTQWTLGWQ